MNKADIIFLHLRKFPSFNKLGLDQQGDMCVKIAKYLTEKDCENHAKVNELYFMFSAS